jgi:biotin synthase
MNNHPDISQIARRAIGGTGCTREEAQALTGGSVKPEELFGGANKIREAHFGNRVNLCAIVNARAGQCSEDCRFCAQSAHHKTEAECYSLLGKDAILEAAKKMTHSGAATFGIVTSGPTVDDEELGSISETVGDMFQTSGLQPCASLGSLTFEQFVDLKNAGLTRFHHNLETSQNYFPKVCSTHTWEERVECIRNAQRAGLEVCSGGLFGLGESWNDRIDMAITLRELEVRSVPLNFLNPVKGTPLGESEPLRADEALRIIAVYRFLLPTATLRVCGGRPVVLRDRQREIFRAGANALMTGDYLTVAGISPDTDRKMIAELGLVIEK